MFPKYSIIIPTRNGLKYLQFAIQSVLQQSELDFELIVSDNHSTDGTWEYINSIKDSRLVCIQPDRPLSMLNHFEFVLQQPKGEWITLFGDDDGVQPYFFELANELTKKYNHLEVINSTRSYYCWEGSEIRYNCVVDYAGAYKFEIIKSVKALRKLLFSEAVYFDFPQFYTGTIFRRSFLENVRKRQGGIIFNSITPDANSVAIILKNAKEYAYSHIPLGWVGTSVKSTGFSASSTAKEVKTSINDFSKLNLNDQITVHTGFPFFIEIFDISLFFLEALYQNNLLLKPGLYKILDQYFIKHLVFLKVYFNYLKRRNGSKVLADQYLNVFAANGLNIKLLGFLKIFKSVYNRLNLLSNKIKSMFTAKFVNQQQQVFSLLSKSHTAFPNILDASKASLKLYVDLKNAVSK